MPANTRSGSSVSSTRSLNVPGSPSSALHTANLRSPGAARAISHLMPVGKPAPPRPRSRAVFTARITSVGLIAAALRMASPRRLPVRTMGPDLRIWLRTIERTSSWALFPSPSFFTRRSGVMCVRSSATTSRARSLERSVTTTSFTSAAGAWSLIPMQAVRSSVIAPSGVVWPSRIPSSSAERPGHALVAREPVHHVVAQPDHDLAFRRLGEERVEGDQALHRQARHGQIAVNRVDGFGRDAAELRLDFAGHVHEPGRVVPDQATGLADDAAD